MAKPAVIVVGAGVVGTAVAYFLATAGAQVTVVERSDLGGGTSSRCDGNVLAIDKDPGYDSRLADVSQRLLHDLAARLGPMEYRAPGSYLVCDTEEEVDPARAWAASLAETGLPCRFLDREAIHRELPDIAEDVPAGLYCASDATLNPLLYTHRLAEAAEAAGARILTHRAARLRVADGRVRGVQLDEGQDIETLDADWTIVAAGVWSPALVEPLGLTLPVRPRKGTLLVGARGPLYGRIKVMEFGYLMTKFGRERQVPEDVERYGVALVYEATKAQNFLLGSSREFVGFDVDPDPAVMAAITRRAVRFYPDMKGAALIRAYAGLRPWTPDHLPIVGAVPAVPGLALACGHEGDGIGLAAVTGALMRDIVLEQPPVVDPEPLRFDRFAGVTEDEAGQDGMRS
jgi:glycine/D-amino acid oxidase-like deaminating enzyme